MKKISNIFKMISIASLTCFLGSIITVGLKNNDVVSDKKQYKNSISENKIITKEIDAKLIGADKGTITIEYTTPSECKIISCSSSFLASGDFNFNGGKFVYDGVEYTISEIANDAFSPSSTGWYFKECNLTIPASIKKIGDYAFYGNSRNTFLSSKEIIGLNFEEGIEDIGIKAFKKCKNLESNILSLPNSLQHIGNNAFSFGFEDKSYIEELDLSALDHVINIDANPFSQDGCLSNANINKNIIWLKDDAIRDKYCSDKHWSSVAWYFVLKGQISKTINSKYIGGNSNSTFDFDYVDPKQTKITGRSSEFAATGNFNFNGGKFTYDGTEYVISEIANYAFCCGSVGWWFKECNLTIPASIKKIRDSAFYGNSRNWGLSDKEIIGLNFEEGIEDIGKEAFKKCNDLQSSQLVLPNSLQHIGNNAFEDISPLEELDLSALDRVISLDANPFGNNGCFKGTKINTIWVKDQAMKDKYRKDQFWSSVAKYFVLKDYFSKTINSKYIGGDSNSTFDFNYLDPKQTKITGVSSKFVATGNFNFNGGEFTYNNVKYAIEEIASDAFNAGSTHWYFKNCKLTIPSTVKTIGDRAFYGNSRNTFFSDKEIIGLNFEEGIEDIGKDAFKKCDDLQSSQLVLPNSLQHIGNNAFEDISPLKELDLSALDHVINLDADPFSEDGCLHDTNIKTIWVKDKDMKDKYCKDQFWSSAEKYFALKDSISKTIDFKLIEADEGWITIDYTTPSECKITDCSLSFLASGDFNFNNGKFTYNNVEYAISEIASDTFHSGDTFSFGLINWYFKNCKLTIPSTIKKIGDRAFYGNSRNMFFSDKEIIGLNFEEGIEDIGKEAFKKCNDLKSSQLVLPNSLQHIGNNAFAEINPLKELDLSALDHVISLDANPFDEKGCLHGTKINTIWVKDQAMKDKYCSDKHWSWVSAKIKVKSQYKSVI